MDRRRKFSACQSQVGLDQHQVCRCDSWHRWVVSWLVAPVRELVQRGRGLDEAVVAKEIANF